jgi:hypothetical protein
MRERSTRGFKPFEKGEQVWLEGKNLHIGYRSRKLAPKREGPFVFSEVLGPVTYRLKLPTQWRIHPVFHASLLTPYRENDIHGPNFTQPPPDLIEGEPEYEVEAIVAHRKRGNGYQYRVKWVGYPSSEDTWQNAESLKRAKEILQAYKKKNHL